jgi:hypothetical protein
VFWPGATKTPFPNVNLFRAENRELISIGEAARFHEFPLSLE